MGCGQADSPDCAHGIDHISCERLHAVVPLGDGLRLQPEAAIWIEDKRSCGHPCLLSLPEASDPRSARPKAAARPPRSRHLYGVISVKALVQVVTTISSSRPRE